MVDSIKELKFGPGVKHAIIWLSIITSFAAGWYVRGQVLQGELARSDLVQLEKDVDNKAKNRAQRESDEKKFDEIYGELKYDKECGDMLLRDFHAK